MLPSSPWSHIVGGDNHSTAVAAAASPSSASPASPETEVSGAGSVSPGNAAPAKKPAWNVPSNGATEPSPVMDAVSWPALTESARASPRSPPDSSKPADASPPYPSPQGLVIASHPPKPIVGNASPNSNPATPPLARQKSGKRGGGSFAPPHAADAGQAPSADSSPRHGLQKKNNWEGGSKESPVPQFHNGNSHPRSSFRRGNGGGPQPRGGGGGGGGEGGYHGNYSNRRDHDRQGYEWGNHQGPMQHQRFAPRNFHRPPQFVGPPPMRPFGAPIGYTDMSSPYFLVQSPPPPPETFRGVQYVAHPVPLVMYQPHQDPKLVSMLVKQIDYYFSSENLCKDIYLRKNMDDQGWVPISLIAGFNRVKQLTTNIQHVLAAIQFSTVVEVQGDKLRRQNDWRNWLLPPSNQFSHTCSPLSHETSNMDVLAAGVQSIRIEGTPDDSDLRCGMVEPHALSRSSSGVSNNQ